MVHYGKETMMSGVGLSVHWRRQLRGTGARAPLDFQLVILREQEQILREQIPKMYKNNVIFAQFLSIFGPFLSFFAHSFPQGVIIVPKMPGTIANKFQLHTYFRFR